MLVTILLLILNKIPYKRKASYISSILRILRVLEEKEFSN